jgi:multiple sugar transport system substrate-binding protein
VPWHARPPGRSAWDWAWSHRGWSGFTLGICAGLALAVLFSVVRPLVSDGDALETGDLVILSGKDESANGQRQALIDQWNALHPQNKARIEELPGSSDSQHSEMVARAQSGRPGVDIYNLDVTWTAEFADAGYIQPLDESTVDIDGFLASPLATCRYEGDLWGLPFNTDAGLLYYRTDLVKHPPASWAQLTAVAEEQLGRRDKPPQLVAGYTGQLSDYEGLTVNALEAIWSADGDVVDSGGDVVVDSPDAKRGLSRLTPSNPQLVLAESRQYDEAASAQAFRDGKVVFMRNWPVAYRSLEASSRDDGGAGRAFPFGVTTLPGPSVLGGQNLAVAAGTDKPRAAQALSEFLTSPRSQQILFERGGFAATREIVYRDEEVTQKYRYALTLLSAIRQARPRPVTPYYAGFSEEFRGVIRQAMDAEGQLPADATDRLTDALNGHRR